MSSRVFQGVIVQMKDATVRTLGVVDSDGDIVACSELSLIGSNVDGLASAMESAGDRELIFCGRTYKAVGGNGRFDYAVFVDGVDDLAKTLCIMACVAVSEANTYYEEKNDKSILIKKIITDNILPGDVYGYSKELHFSSEVARGVFLVRQLGRTDVTVVDSLRKLFSDRQRDFIVSINESDVAVVKEIPLGTESKELYRIAQSIETQIRQDLGIRTVIGVGTPVAQLRDLADRFKEAQTAIDVGHVFEPETAIIQYENLGIGRLIYQLPVTLCEMFLSEVFKKNPIEALDEETLEIINKFFENNLNISETSRKLFVHRNTLVYRLGKIKKLSGLDLREFDQAIVFKVALMVKKYLDSQR